MSIISKLRVFELFGKPHLRRLSAALQDADNTLNLANFHGWVNTVVVAEGMWATSLLLRMHGKLNKFLGRNSQAAFNNNMPPITLMNLCVAHIPWQSVPHLPWQNYNNDYALLAVKCILSAGADATKIWSGAPVITQRKFGSPLFMAARRGLDPVVRLLLDHGENPNVWNCDNNTPLFMAVREHKVGVVRLLLAAGAKKNTGGGRNYNGTMLELAVEEEKGLRRDKKTHPPSARLDIDVMAAKEIIELLR